MKKLSFSIFVALVLLVSVSCTDPHLLVDPRKDYRKARKSLQFEVMNGSLELSRVHEGKLFELLAVAELKNRTGLPEKQFCYVQPGRIYLVTLKQKASAKEALEEITRYGYQPIDICTLTAIAIEYPDEARNIVALKEYKSDSELCGRAYLNQDADHSSEHKPLVRMLSRRFCTDEFTANAIFAVRR